MKDIHIPPAALEAGARALASHYSYDWNENEELHAIWKEEAAACITRALNAWPGMFEEYMNNEAGDGASVCVILPKGGDND